MYRVSRGRTSEDIVDKLISVNGGNLRRSKKEAVIRVISCGRRRRRSIDVSDLGVGNKMMGASRRTVSPIMMWLDGGCCCCCWCWRFFLLFGSSYCVYECVCLKRRKGVRERERVKEERNWQYDLFFRSSLDVSIVVVILRFRYGQSARLPRVSINRSFSKDICLYRMKRRRSTTCVDQCIKQ